MREITAVIAEFKNIVEHPELQVEKYAKEGKKMVGCIPYFYPEELVSACEMVPIGLWGAQMEVAKARAYWPAFICSMLQTVLEQGMNGQLDALSAVIIPLACDSMKNMRLNWSCGVPHIPFIDMPMAQNRKLDGGIRYTKINFRNIQAQLAEISGKNPSDAEIQEKIDLYNKNRAVLRRFSELAAEHADVIRPSVRCAVIKSRYFMTVDEHTKLTEELNSLLEAVPPVKWNGPKIVTTGIMADSTDLLAILDENGYAVVDDEVTQESLYFREDTPHMEDPVEAMAVRISRIEGCAVLYDPGKRRAKLLVELAQNRSADGVVFVLTKFCDPEEYDYVPVKNALEAAGIPLLLIESDQQMKNYEQARSALETFKEMLA